MSDNQKTHWFKRIENMHPYRTLLYLGMFGSGLIFLFMTVAFLYSVYGQAIPLYFNVPLSFVASTFVLSLSSFYVSKIHVHYRQDNTKKLKKALWITFLLGLLFMVLQSLGWWELNQRGIEFRGIPAGSFLYVLSGIHIFHLVGVMVFALLLILQVRQKEKDEIRTLVMLSNPFEKMKLDLFKTYWYFVDMVWLILFFVFLLAFSI